MLIQKSAYKIHWMKILRHACRPAAVKAFGTKAKEYLFTVCKFNNVQKKSTGFGF